MAEVQSDPLGIGITEAELNSLKATHKGLKLQKMPDGSAYIVRPLTRLEYRNLQKVVGNMERSDIEEKICSMGIVWPRMDPTQVNLALAGTASTISELIMQISNFGVAAEPIDL